MRQKVSQIGNPGSEPCPLKVDRVDQRISRPRPSSAIDAMASNLRARNRSIKR